MDEYRDDRNATELEKKIADVCFKAAVLFFGALTIALVLFSLLGR